MGHGSIVIIRVYYSLYMNQTTWIALGSVFVIGIAVYLYMSGGTPASNSVATSTDAFKVEDMSTKPAAPVVDNTPKPLVGALAPKPIPMNPTTGAPTPVAPAAAAKDTIVTMKTSMGDITIKLYASDSPKTVANFVKLAKEGFYNGTKFHRVIKDFMIQGGDPQSKDDTKMSLWGTGGPGYAFADEFNSHKLVKGSLAMANSGPNTNGSQFFIVTADATPWLDGKHTNFGMVTSGMDVVMKIGTTPTGASDRPVTPVVVNSISVQ